MDSIMATLLAPIARRELNRSYSSAPPEWRPLARRNDPTIGRKRRARRARGGRIKTKRPYSSAALAMAEALKADAKQAEFWRPLAERWAADFVRQAENILHA